MNVMKPTIKIAVLMTTYNRVTNTINCLENLFNCFIPKDFSLNVFIADSNSSDNTESIIKKKYPSVEIFNIGDNNFWNQGMIKAWKRSLKINPDFFLWLNDDTFLYRNSIKDILNDYSKKKNSIIVGVTEAEKVLTYGGRPNLKENILNPNGIPQKIKIMNGNFVLIPKQVFEIVGYFNNKFSHSLGDIDYGLRAIENGIQIYCTSNIIGICKKNDFIWYDSKSFSIRFKNLISPKGVPPFEYFYFNLRHFGFIRGIKFIMGTFLALISPRTYKSIVRQ